MTLKLRWALVLAICVWVAYEYGKDYIKSVVWDSRFQMHIKVGVAILVCVLILSMPTLDTLLEKNAGLADYVRMYLQQNSPTSMDVHSRVWSGISMAGGDDEYEVHRAPRAEEAEAGAPGPGIQHASQPDTLPPLAEQAEADAVPEEAQPEINDTLRRKVAAAQNWKCDVCRKPLHADFVVDQLGARCSAKCSRSMAKRKHMVYFS